MKTIRSVYIFILILINLTSLNIKASNFKIIDGVKYEYDVLNGVPSAEVCPNDQSSITSITEINIAEYLNIDGTYYKVVGIQDNSFKGYTNLVSVIFPSSIIKIGDNAFENTALIDISLPESLIHIGSNAFKNTSISNIILPGKLEYIGESTFENCHIENIIIPNNIKEIGNSAFNCKNLRKVIFNAFQCNKIGFNGGYYRENSAFPEFVNTIEVGEDVDYIPYLAFYFCDDLNTLIYNARKAIIEIPSSLDIRSPFNRNVSEVKFGSEVMSIPDYLLFGCRYIKEINVPESVSSIGNNAFFDCLSMESLTLPKYSITSIGESAFQNCTSLKSVSLPNTLDSLGEKAFKGCESLKFLDLGYKLRRIPSYAFEDCNSLEELELPNQIKEIGQKAFANCNGIKKVNFPSGISLLGEEAFVNCTSVPFIEFKDLSGGNVKIERGCFRNCINIYSVKFYGCELYDESFQRCENLKEINFMGHNNRTLFNGENIFDDCPIEKINMDVQFRGDLPFKRISTIKDIWVGSYVQILRKDEFKESKNSLHSLSFDGSGNGQAVLYGETAMGIQDSFRGDSIFLNKQIIYLDENEYPSDIAFGIGQFKKIELPSYNFADFFKSIPKNAFAGSEITSLKIERINKIEEGAFKDCSGLSFLQFKLTNPFPIPVLEDNAFTGCPINIIEFINPSSEVVSTFNDFPDNSFEAQVYETALLLYAQNISGNAINDSKWSKFENKYHPQFDNTTHIIEIEEGDIYTLDEFFSLLDTTHLCEPSLEYNFNFFLRTGQKDLYNNEYLLFEDNIIRALNKGNVYGHFYLYIPYKESYWYGESAINSSSNGGYNWGGFDFEINIKRPELSIELENENITAKVGEEIKLIANVFPDKIRYKYIPQYSTYYVNDVLEITNTGIVKCLKEGSNIVLVSLRDEAGFGLVSAKCEINVLSNSPSSIYLNLESAELNIGETIQLEASVLPENTTDKTVIWSSSDDNVATVYANGLVTAVSEGASIITATCGDVSATCEITVKTDETPDNPDDAGVESLLTNPDTKISIYRPDGFLIKKDCKVEDLKMLNNGIYILVSGKERYKISI